MSLDNVTPFPAARISGGELVQSLTYREAYTPTPAAYALPRRRTLLDTAPAALRTAVGAAWAIVAIGAAAGVLLVLVLLAVRVVGWLT